MAKQKNIKKSNSKKPSTKLFWFKNHKLITFAIIALVIFSGFWVKKQIDISNEREDFQTAERVVADLVNEIQKELGKTEVEENKGCGYASAKFSKGRLGCSFSYTIDYPGVDHEKAEDLAKRADKIVSNNPRIYRTGVKNIDFHEPEKLSNLDIQKVDNNINIDSASEVYCSISYAFSVHHKELTKNLSINVVCRSPDGTKTNYYPIKN